MHSNLNLFMEMEQKKIFLQVTKEIIVELLPNYINDCMNCMYI